LHYETPRAVHHSYLVILDSQASGKTSGLPFRNCLLYRTLTPVRGSCSMES
jgi:hypothetical protein